MAGTVPYLNVADFRAGTIAPVETVDLVERKKAGFLMTRSLRWSSHIDSRLTLRYATPFAAPYPTKVLQWMDALMTRDLYHASGYQPSSEQDTNAVEAPAERAEEEIEQAANSETGLFGLPLRSDTDASGVTRGGPFSSSQASPYVWTTQQRDRARIEDGNG